MDVRADNSWKYPLANKDDRLPSRDSHLRSISAREHCVDKSRELIDYGDEFSAEYGWLLGREAKVSGSVPLLAERVFESIW